MPAQYRRYDGISVRLLASLRNALLTRLASDDVLRFAANSKTRRYALPRTTVITFAGASFQPFRPGNEELVSRAPITLLPPPEGKETRF